MQGHSSLDVLEAGSSGCHMSCADGLRKAKTENHTWRGVSGHSTYAGVGGVERTPETSSDAFGARTTTINQSQDILFLQFNRVHNESFSHLSLRTHEAMV
jgi:hypothetical protein